jgi:hypothetical protein
METSLQRTRKHSPRQCERKYYGSTIQYLDDFGVLDQPSHGLLGLPWRSRLTSRERLSAIELLASFIDRASARVDICVRWPPDNGEALVIFSDKRVHAGPECAVPLLGLCEETIRNQLE